MFMFYSPSEKLGKVADVRICSCPVEPQKCNENEPLGALSAGMNWKIFGKSEIFSIQL